MHALSRPLRVLHVVPSFYPAHVYGGATYSFHRLCLALAERGLEVRVLTTDADGGRRLAVDTRGETELAAGLRVQYCARWGGESVSPALVSRLRASVAWADVVHVGAVYSFPTWPTLLACRLAGKPVVWSPRGGLRRWTSTSSRRWLKTVWRSVCRRLLARDAILHVTSTQEAEDAELAMPGVRLVTIPNGVDLVPLHPLAAPTDGLRLLFVGRLHPAKGLERLLEACADLRRTGDLERLSVAGAGEDGYVQALRSRIDALGLIEVVALLGDVRGLEKERLYCESHIVVVPSHTESFGMVVAEALAHGRPVVASRGTPWQELEDRGCGLWVENSPGEMAQAIRRMARMPLAEMGERGHAWMIRDFTWERAAARMDETYRSLLAS